MQPEQQRRMKERNFYLRSNWCSRPTASWAAHHQDGLEWNISRWNPVAEKRERPTTSHGPRCNKAQKSENEEVNLSPQAWSVCRRKWITSSWWTNQTLQPPLWCATPDYSPQGRTRNRPNPLPLPSVCQTTRPWSDPERNQISRILDYWWKFCCVPPHFEMCFM